MWLGEGYRYSEEDLCHLTLGFIGAYEPNYTTLSLFRKPGEGEEAAKVVGGGAEDGGRWRDWRDGERKGEWRGEEKRGEAEDWRRDGGERRGKETGERRGKETGERRGGENGENGD